MKRDEFGFVLPNLYYQFLSEWEEIAPYEIGDSGICLYAKKDLQERNETYQIEEVEPDYFMIGRKEIWPTLSRKMLMIAFMKMTWVL